MHDQDLDQLLQHTRGPDPSHEAIAAARELSARLRPITARRRPRRRLVLAGALAGGALLVSGAASLTAYQLSIPPFQTLPDGLQRLDHPIPLDFVRPDGTSGRCLVFLEFRNVPERDLDRLDDVVRDRAWTLAQQQQVAGTTGEPAPTSEREAWPVDGGDHLFAFAVGVLPGLRDGLDADGEDVPTFSGYGATCRDDAS